MAWYDPRTWFRGDSSETPGPTNRDEPQASLEQVEHELGPTLSSLHGPFSLAQTSFLNTMVEEKEEEDHINNKILPDVVALDRKLARYETSLKKKPGSAVRTHRVRANNVAEMSQQANNIKKEVVSLLAIWNGAKLGEDGLHKNVEHLQQSLRMTTSIVVRATQRWDKHIVAYLKHHHVRYDRLQIQRAETLLAKLQDHKENLSQEVGKLSAAVSVFSTRADAFFAENGNLSEHLQEMRFELDKVKTSLQSMVSELAALRGTLKRGRTFIRQVKPLDELRF